LLEVPREYLETVIEIRGIDFYVLYASHRVNGQNSSVFYAKHAISIDENRADFKRVGWSPTAEKQDERDSHGNLYFEQVWFPGVHADVGGGYLENEARLSDVALSWLLAGASLIPGGLKHDGSVLRLSPNPAGPQHNEQSGGFLKAGVRDLPVDSESGESKSPMHKSVYRRFGSGIGSPL
jgi:hypothetical protein